MNLARNLFSLATKVILKYDTEEKYRRMKEELIAPCGMNCAICSSYLALKYNVKSKGIRISYCKGCRPRDKKCAFIKKKCNLLLNGRVEFCFECKDSPCAALAHLDQKYRAHFRMSMIDNLEFIRENGMPKFLAEQKEKWQCTKCGDVICCHNGICFSCSLDELKNKKKPYRWED